MILDKIERGTVPMRCRPRRGLRVTPTLYMYYTLALAVKEKSGKLQKK